MQRSNQMQWGGLAAMGGGFLWALTPLREPLLGGEFPEHPVFRPYNIVLLGITILLTMGLLAVSIIARSCTRISGNSIPVCCRQYRTTLTLRRADNLRA